MHPEIPSPINPDRLSEQQGSHIETTSSGGRVYNVEALEPFAERLEAKEVPLEDLRYAVSEGHYYWEDRKGEKLGPHQILQDWEAAQQNEDWADHVATIKRADLTHPIWMAADGTIINGTHRLTRAFLDHAETINVRIFGELSPEVEGGD